MSCTGATHSAPAQVSQDQRWLAWLAFAAAMVVLLSGALRNVTALLLGFRWTGHYLHSGAAVAAGRAALTAGR